MFFGAECDTAVTLVFQRDRSVTPEGSGE